MDDKQWIISRQCYAGSHILLLVLPCFSLMNNFLFFNIIRVNPEHVNIIPGGNAGRPQKPAFIIVSYGQLLLFI